MAWRYRGGCHGVEVCREDVMVWRCVGEDVMMWRCVGRRMSWCEGVYGRTSWCEGVCREEDVMV